MEFKMENGEAKLVEEKDSSEFTPLPNEEILWKAKADQWIEATNILARIMTFFVKIVMFIFGIRKTGNIIATNQRIIYFSKEYTLWIFKTANGYESLFLNQIAGTNLQVRAGFLMFFKKKTLSIKSTGSGDVKFTFKKIKHDELEAYTAKLNEFVIASNH